MVASTPEPDDGKARVRLLVIDDNPAEVELLRSAIEKFGYAEFASIASGRVAMEQLTHIDLRQFDLVLVDWRLPGIPGDAVAKAFLGRQDPERRAPIVLLSSALPPKIADEMRQAGAVVLDKPVDLDGYECLARRLAELAKRPIAISVAT